MIRGAESLPLDMFDVRNLLYLVMQWDSAGFIQFLGPHGGLGPV